MGKKARKTRWRALAVDNGNCSDSEESNAIHADKSHHHYGQSYSTTASGGSGHHYDGYQPQSHYGGVQRSYRAGGGGGGGGRFGHHPQRYYAHSHAPNHHRPTGASRSDDGASSPPPPTGGGAGTGTQADGKITFNEDEYTRITTPRQDVLFKKGYLSKPKAYQTQTSTGASTISTGNSTGNGTPDHQSADGTEGTDLEYESQFVFPNGFVDQNGIYYVNSFEPYPLVVYNPPMCYPEYVASPRCKRLSTGSLTESTSPHNEDASQELSHSGGENVGHLEYGHSVYNLVFPGYYGYGVPPEMELSHGEPRKIKKRRRRKLSKPVPEGNWTTSSSDDYDESEEMVSEIENRIIQGTHRPPAADSPPSNAEDGSTTTSNDAKDEGATKARSDEQAKAGAAVEGEVMDEKGKSDGEEKAAEVKEEAVEAVEKVASVDGAIQTDDCAEASAPPVVQAVAKKGLKADAKEFVPRYFHHQPHHHRHPHAPFIANLIPLPPPSFLHGAAHPQQLHVLAAPPPPSHRQARVQQVATLAAPASRVQVQATIANDVPAAVIPSAAQDAPPPSFRPPAPATPQPMPETAAADVAGGKRIDIAKIVSKLEAAAKEQRSRAGAPKTGNQRARRNHARHFPVELNVDGRASSVKVEAKSVSVSTSTSTTCVQPAHGQHKNYAQMLCRKSTATSPMKRCSRSPVKDVADVGAPLVTSQSVASVSNHGVAHPTPPKASAPNQWIAVQSRKKRKNRNQECDWDEPEVEVNVGGAPLANEPKVCDDGFESYDVSKLEDVVVAPKPAVAADAAQDKDNKPAVPEIEEVVRVESRDDVRDIVIEQGVLVPVVSVADQRAAEEEEFDKLIRTLEALEAKTPQKRKTLNRAPNKRVMITDHGVEEVLPLIITEITDKDEKSSKDLKAKKTKSKSKSKTAEEVPVTPAIPKQEEEEEEVVEAPASFASVELNSSESAFEASRAAVVGSRKSADESPDKKKKKKKPPKKLPAASLTLDTPPPTAPATPSASVTVDETSYDFLLADGLLETERTNLEVSEALDKLIQRGMFTSLEEKIRSLNITATSADDGFFRSMSAIVDAPSTSAKEDDLTTILAKTTNIFAAKRPACAPTSAGSFLDLASLREDDPGISGARGGRPNDDYPITKAVKDWMVRTRETTPEVELLKSPRTILKEIGGSMRSGGGSSVRESWSLTPESSFDDEDLLECWDDLDATAGVASTTSSSSPAAEAAARDPDVDKQRQIEASLEVYESMYGKNEDFKQIKAEIEERKRNGTLPKHGGLPYRAVCCSVM